MKRYNLAVSVYLTEYVAPGKPVIGFYRPSWDNLRMPELKVDFDIEKFRYVLLYKGATPGFTTLIGGM